MARFLRDCWVYGVGGWVFQGKEGGVCECGASVTAHTAFSLSSLSHTHAQTLTSSQRSYTRPTRCVSMRLVEVCGGWGKECAWKTKQKSTHIHTHTPPLTQSLT